MKRKKVLIIGGVIICLAAVFVMLPKPKSFKEIARQYDFITLKRMDLSERVDATGNVIALAKKDIYADYEGSVAKVSVKAGDQVKKGAILIAIDSSALEREWQEANFNLQEAELSVNQSKAQLATELAINRLNTSNAIQVESNYHQLDLNQEQVKQAKEKVAALKVKNDGYYAANNGQLFIRAPFDGQIAWINVRPGDKISPQSLLATVLKPEALGVEAQIDENDISLVRTGQQAEISGNDPAQSKNKGLVTEISVVGRSTTETGQTALATATVGTGVIDFPVRIQLAGKPQGLRPGMSVDVTIMAEEHANVLAVPAGSVINKNGESFVKVRQGNQLIEKRVRLGFEQGKYWEVKAGLRPGDQVAVPKPAAMGKQATGTGQPARMSAFGR